MRARFRRDEPAGLRGSLMGSNLLGSALLRLSLRARHSDTLAVLGAIRREPFVSPEQARERQLRRLLLLLAHCEAQVPFYRRRFQQLGIGSRDIRSFEDYARLPPLTKQDVAEHAEALIAESVPRDSLLAHHSGGSTGVPLRFYRTREDVVASEAGTYRNLLQSGWQPGEMIAFFWGWNDKLAAMGRAEFFARQVARRMYQFDPFRSGEAELAAWWRTWRLIRPAVALGYASTLARFAKFLEAHSHQPAPLRGVFTTAEKLHAPQRSVLERVFRCRVFDSYGSSEVQNIAAECAHGSMHVNADFAVVEVEPESLAGGAGPLLVTSLKNLAMPFLRYRNEDTGGLRPGACGCGNGFPLMSLEVTRVSDNFTLPGGRVVHGEFFTHLMYGSEGIENFQFHQVSPGSIILRYVPARTGSPSAALSVAVAQIEALAPGQLAVRVESVAEIPLSSAGKHRFTRSDVV